jgi:hypothetical protein
MNVPFASLIVPLLNVLDTNPNNPSDQPNSKENLYTTSRDLTPAESFCNAVHATRTASTLES